MCLAIRRIAAIAALAVPLLAAGPAVAGQKPAAEGARKEIGATARDSAKQREAALRKSKAALDDLDKRIDRLGKELRARWGEMDQAARKEGRAALRALKEEREQAAEGYRELERSSASSWARVKKGFAGAYEKLKSSWQKTQRELGPAE